MTLMWICSVRDIIEWSKDNGIALDDIAKWLELEAQWLSAFESRGDSAFSLDHSCFGLGSAKAKQVIGLFERYKSMTAKMARV